MDDREMRARVAGGRVARLASLTPDGRLHLVPFCYALDGDTLYSVVDDKPKRSRRLQRLRNIEAHPQVCVLVDHYEDDWEQVWWVRLRGGARVLDEGEERDRALELLRERYVPYREDPPTGPVLAVDVEEWRGWTAST